MLARIVFSVVLLLLAWLHAHFHDAKGLNFDAMSVWLGVIAVVPWILTEVGEMVSSLTVSGVFQLNFRELQKKVEAQQIAIEGGVGGPGAGPAGLAGAAATV